MTQVLLALVLGILFALGTYLVLRRDVVRVVWGVSIVSQAANVYLVTMGGLGGGVPILAHGSHPEASAVTDPIVQALVLTAIVIGFGTTALALVLTYRVYQEHGTIDVYELGRNGVNGVDDAAAAGGTGTTETGGDSVIDSGGDAPVDTGGDAGEVSR